MKKLCCLFNYAPHYRAPIYRLMDAQLHCDFYFGKDLREKIEKMDCKSLKGFKKELTNIYLGNWVWRRGVVRLAFDNRYDTYMISGEPHTLSVALFSLFARMMGKKVYSWQHGIMNSKLSGIKLFNQKVLIGLQNGVFLYGNRARDVMISLGYDAGKLHVIYNSLDYRQTVRYNAMASKTVSPYTTLFGNTDPTLLFIGRLTPVKQLDRLFRLFTRLNREAVSCNLILIGDGPEKERLQKEAAQTPFKERFSCIGALYEEEKIANYLYHADLCVSPGNIGLTAIHAASYGLPIVTNNNFDTQMPEYEVVEKGVTGDFFQENNDDDLYEVVCRWLISHAGNRETIRKACMKRIAECYNPEYQIDLLKQVLYGKKMND